MARCIYCLKDGDDAVFRSREHVLPACLGSFMPLNPTITARDGLVCDNCNARVFSPLETNFMEDSYEGIMGQRLNFEGRNSVIMRDKNFKIERVSGFGDKFFNEMFFFLKFQDNKIVPDLKKQVKLRRFQGGYRVFLPEALEEIKHNPSKFKKIASDLKKLNQKDICIFADTQEAVVQIIQLLKEFGVNYREKKNIYEQLAPGDKLELKEDYTCKVNMDIGRVLAKIAFNYFAYCAIQTRATEFLYRNEFNKIRSFITLSRGKLKEIIPSISEEPFLFEERRDNKRIIAHFIGFVEENGILIARTTFFGLPPVYKIILGELPQELRNGRIGCAHIFNPFDGMIMNLTKRETVEPTAEQLVTTFGLFRKIV